MAGDAMGVLEESATDDPVVQYVSSQIKSFRDQTKTPGVAVAVYTGGQGYLLHYGSRVATEQGETTAPVTKETMFAIGSVTKVFTATLLGCQVSTQKMALGDPVTLYLDLTDPILGDIGQVSFQDLATHTSGIDDKTQFQDLGQISTPLFAGDTPSGPLLAYWPSWTNGFPEVPIGTHWDYSNDGFVTLGFAIASAAKIGYPTILDAFITGPLAMKSTMPGDLTPTLGPTLAQGYLRNKAGDLVPVSGKAADLYSTSSDMLIWLKANLGLIADLPKPLASALTIVHGDPEGKPYFDGGKNVSSSGCHDKLKFSMGLAWQISEATPRVFAKDGATSQGGGSSWIGFIRDKPTPSAVAVLTNLDGAGPEKMARDLLLNLPT
jgi:beta-lactamase class C